MGDILFWTHKNLDPTKRLAGSFLSMYSISAPELYQRFRCGFIRDVHSLTKRNSLGFTFKDLHGCNHVVGLNGFLHIFESSTIHRITKCCSRKNQQKTFSLNVGDKINLVRFNSHLIGEVRVGHKQIQLLSNTLLEQCAKPVPFCAFISRLFFVFHSKKLLFQIKIVDFNHIYYTTVVILCKV